MMAKKLPLAFIFLLFIQFLNAQTIQWDGGGDGVNWSDPLNWDSNNIPSVTDDVFI